jgi:5'-nucleotidase
MNRDVGSVSAPLSRAANVAGESALGDVIADAQLEAGAADGAVIAFMNPGGIREDVRGRADGIVVFDDLYSAQPFGNGLVAATMTGAQIDALLEQQFRADGGMTILQASDGFSYEWNASAPVGDKVGGVTLHGAPIDPIRDYRIVLNSFLSTGGDGFTEFLNARDEASLVVDVDALEDYFAAHSPVAPGPQDRIVRVD